MFFSAGCKESLNCYQILDDENQTKFKHVCSNKKEKRSIFKPFDPQKIIDIRINIIKAFFVSGKIIVITGNSIGFFNAFRFLENKFEFLAKLENDELSPILSISKLKNIQNPTAKTRHFVTGDTNGLISILKFSWNSNLEPNLTQIGSKKFHQRGVNCVKSVKNNLILSAGDDQKICIFKVEPDLSKYLIWQKENCSFSSIKSINFLNENVFTVGMDQIVRKWKVDFPDLNSAKDENLKTKLTLLESRDSSVVFPLGMKLFKNGNHVLAVVYGNGFEIIKF
ncbi:hypothetical protein MHBO_002702 [Bonamia ostreae]|uniref:Uncharacterized protein n=1 Tax=Bonamia ostreae TaxID=126728 RepID=A0ABV2AN78_9EUKA